MKEPEPEIVADERRWEKIDAVGYPYSPRTGHTVVAYDKSLYVFGGTDKSRRQHDLFEYSVESKIWSLVQTRGSLPFPRSGALGVVAGSCMYIFGGYDGREGNYYNDLFCFNFGTRSWNQMPSMYSSRPSARTDHVMALFDNCIYIFGGYDGKARYKDMHKYCLTNLRWEKQTYKGDCPSSRFGHSGAVHASSSRLIVFGGWDGKDTLDDLYVYDFLQSYWTKIPPSSSQPPHRYRHTAVIHGDSMFVFGGVNKHHHRFNDLQHLCLKTFVWTEVCVTGYIPSSRTFHRAVVLGNLMYLLGGYDGTNRLHDLYTIHVGRMEPPSMLRLCAKYIRSHLGEVLKHSSFDCVPTDITEMLLWRRDRSGVLRGRCSRCHHGVCEYYNENMRSKLILRLCCCGHSNSDHEQIQEVHDVRRITKD